MWCSMALTSNDWQICIDEALSAESSGYCSITASDSLHEPFAPLAISALVTESLNLRLSSAVALARSPMIMATAARHLHSQSRGRFQLGLGMPSGLDLAQRYGVIAGKESPVSLLEDYVKAIRSIWTSWNTGDRVNYQGRVFRICPDAHTVLKKPAHLENPKILVAASDIDMVRCSARIGDGVRLNDFSSRRYLKERVLPALKAELSLSGRNIATFDIQGGGFVISGPDDETVARGTEWLRQNLARYIASPSSISIVQLHGLEGLAEELSKFIHEPRAERIRKIVSDDVVDLFAARGTYKHISTAIAKHFGGLVDTIKLNFVSGTPDETRREVVSQIRSIPPSQLLGKRSCNTTGRE